MWIFFAVFTAFLWGVCYTSAEQVVKVINRNTYITISAMVNLLIYGVLARPYFFPDLQKLQDTPKEIWWVVATIASASIASYASMAAIEQSNASFAASLEITYPFWCMLFAWILFGKTMTVTSMLGVVVIFAGVIIMTVGAKAQ